MRPVIRGNWQRCSFRLVLTTSRLPCCGDQSDYSMPLVASLGTAGAPKGLQLAGRPRGRKVARWRLHAPSRYPP